MVSAPGRRRFFAADSRGLSADFLSSRKGEVIPIGQESIFLTNAEQTAVDLFIRAHSRKSAARIYVN